MRISDWSSTCALPICKTDRPASAQSAAVTAPPGPEPITTISADIRSGRGSVPFTAFTPFIILPVKYRVEAEGREAPVKDDQSMSEFQPGILPCCNLVDPLG